MSSMFEISEKPVNKYNVKVCNTTSAVNLSEVQVIKNALQEHLIFIGLDNLNNVKNISLLGVGSSNCIFIDSKDIVRTALMSGSERVILVHNHPSNSLKPSEQDKHISNITNKLLELYNIKLQDHIIVAGNDYVSMMEEGAIDKNYSNRQLEKLDKGLLFEENQMLKNEIENLKQMYEKDYDEDMEI